MKRTTMTRRDLARLVKKANKLAEKVEKATEISSEPEVRKGGAKLAEVLDEWLDMHDKGLLDGVPVRRD